MGVRKLSDHVVAGIGCWRSVCAHDLPDLQGTGRYRHYSDGDRIDVFKGKAARIVSTRGIADVSGFSN